MRTNYPSACRMQASDGLWDAIPLPEVYALVERWPPLERSVHDLVTRAVEANGGKLKDDITVLMLRVVPEDRTGYWTPKSVMRQVARNLGLSSGRLAKAPSWHNEYFEADLSVKSLTIASPDNTVSTASTASSSADVSGDLQSPAGQQ